MNRIKTLMAVSAIALTGAVTTSTATAAQLSPTEVTIEAQPGGDFSGYVRSADPNCEDGRKVTLFKMLGDAPDRSVDRKIATDTSSSNGSEGEWSTGNTGERKGKFYARVGKTSLCKGDVSPYTKAKR